LPACALGGEYQASRKDAPDVPTPLAKSCELT
jgi:hypothetical protein